MIVCSFALPSESAPFVDRLHHSAKVAAGALPWILGSLGRDEVLVVHTGIGPESARETTESVLKVHEPWLWVSSGVAGALDSRLAIGDIFVAENVGTEKFVRRALAVGADAANVRSGGLATVDEPAMTPDEKAGLAGRTGASAVDMETASVRVVCEAHGVPLVSIRAISDGARDPLPLPLPVWFDMQAQRPRTLVLAAHLLRHPEKLDSFAEFTRHFFVARKNLAAYLDQFFEAL